jgi:flavin-dependent dehydrogenase
MNTQPAMSNNQGSGTALSHAVVIGSSIAGLTLARVLADHFARVTIIERDRSESRLRHYEKLPCYLEGFLVSGDAVYTLNPVYAQGMTAAAMASLALDRSLQAQRRRSGAAHLSGLAREFQQQLSRVEAEPWRLVTGQDRRWPTTQVTEDTLPAPHRVPDHCFNPMPMRTGYQVAHQ